MSKVFTISEGLENMGAIKTGGQGSVYKGRRIGEIITAIKLLPTPIISQDEDNKHYQDFINEVKKLQRVGEEHNPNIVKILSYGVSETGCFPYIEMEYIEGPDLCELLKPPHPPVFTVKEVIKVAEQLSSALAHCHKLDVKHGDIKSNNLKYNHHTGNYVLLDFGLAILSDEERRTSLRRAGAIEFMAPEQNEGRMYFETDVYSFGIVLYELLAGKVPFPLDGNSETARNKVMVAHMEMPPPNVLSLREQNLPPDWSEEQKAQAMQVPEWLTSLVYKCLEKKPQDRFENGIALHEFISHHYTHAQEPVDANSDISMQRILSQRQNQIEAKDRELNDLRAVISKQDEELRSLRNGDSHPEYAASKKTVSKKAFTALLVLTVLLGGVSLYAIFLTPKTAGVLTTGVSTKDSIADSSVTINAAMKNKEGRDPEKSNTKPKDNLQRVEITPDELPAYEERAKAEEQKPVEGNEAGVKRADTLQKKAPRVEKDSVPQNKKEIDTTGINQ